MTQSATGKVIFEKEGQLLVEVNEDTATVLYISAAVKREYGDTCILVTNDGLEILDQAATKGLKFWKVPGCKVYAVDASEVSKIRNVPPIISKSSEQPSIKWRNIATSDMDMVIQDQLADIQGAVTSLSKELSRILKLTPQTQIPLGLKATLGETFKCKICHEAPMKPPLIASKCCKILIGCSTCVDRWYSGVDTITKPCPNCRVERGYSETFRFLGFDDFKANIEPLFDQQEQASTSE